MVSIVLTGIWSIFPLNHASLYLSEFFLYFSGLILVERLLKDSEEEWESERSACWKNSRGIRERKTFRIGLAPRDGGIYFSRNRWMRDADGLRVINKFALLSHLSFCTLFFSLFPRSLYLPTFDCSSFLSRRY